jgi:hypothetical protein
MQPAGQGEEAITTATSSVSVDGVCVSIPVSQDDLRVVAGKGNMNSSEIWYAQVFQAEW